MEQRTRLGLRAAAPLLGATLLLTACGTADDGASTTADAAPTTAAVTTEDPTTASTPENVTETAIPGRASGVESTPEQPTTEPCATDGLSTEILGQQGAAGSLIYALGFTNTGGTPCTLHGFPGVSLVGHGDGTQLGRAATREGDDTLVVTVPPGGTAEASLRVSRAENFAPAACDMVAADGLRIYPPNQTTADYLPLEGVNACANPEAELLSVRPVTRAPQN